MFLPLSEATFEYFYKEYPSNTISNVWIVYIYRRILASTISKAQESCGGKGSQIYVVTDSSDHDVANPTPGTLHHAVIQTEPLWIVFAANMQIKLKHELIVISIIMMKLC